MQRLESIYLRNLAQGRDYEGFIDLDISKNTITESSVRYLADVLKKFQGFRSINMSNMAKLKETAFLELFKSLRDNHSLAKLDLSKNSLS